MPHIVRDIKATHAGVLWRANVVHRGNSTISAGVLRQQPLLLMFKLHWHL